MRRPPRPRKGPWDVIYTTRDTGMEGIKRLGLRGHQGLGHSQAEHGLHGDKQCRNIEGLKKHLCCLLPVLTGVQWGLREKNRMLREMRESHTHTDKPGTGRFLS